MLALTRHDQQSIMIGSNVEIMILNIQPGKVRIGIKAPESVSIHRKEIYESIQRGEKNGERTISNEE